MTKTERNLLQHGFYFFDEASIKEFWRTNAFAERKTKLIDLADFRNGCSVSNLRQEIERHHAARNSIKEKELHLDKMREYLTDEGYLIYMRSFDTSHAWELCPLPAFDRSLPFTSLVKYREIHHLNSNTSAMQHLVKSGAVRIKIGTRALWLEPNPEKYLIPIAIPVD